MNYEKIIIELLGRIQVLEEQVAELMKDKAQSNDTASSKITTDDIRQYIANLKKISKSDGKRLHRFKIG